MHSINYAFPWKPLKWRAGKHGTRSSEEDGVEKRVEKGAETEPETKWGKGEKMVKMVVDKWLATKTKSTKRHFTKFGHTKNLLDIIHNLCYVRFTRKVTHYTNYVYQHRLT